MIHDQFYWCILNVVMQAKIFNHDIVCYPLQNYSLFDRCIWGKCIQKSKSLVISLTRQQMLGVLDVPYIIECPFKIRYDSYQLKTSHYSFFHHQLHITDDSKDNFYKSLFS